MKILIGCEESQAICKAFRERGFEAYSCDLLPCSGGHHEWHFQMDLFEAVKKEKWTLGVFHPSCTFLAVSGARWMYNKDGSINEERKKNQEDSLNFVRKIMELDIPHIAIENPISVISTKIRKPDQIIQPWQFGDSASKATCLWLKNLPKLIPTKVVDKGEFVTFNSGRRMSKWMAELRGNGHLRSKTFLGIASAIAEQWGDFIRSKYE